MSTKIAINLPVDGLAGSTRFFTALGFPRNEQLADDRVQAVVVNEHISVLLIEQSQFKAITKKEIPDSALMSEVVLQLQVDSRQRVDELANNAFAGGALAANEPNDQGFLYGRSFRDPDGHHWDVFCIDPTTNAPSP